MNKKPMNEMVAAGLDWLLPENLLPKPWEVASTLIDREDRLQQNKIRNEQARRGLDLEALQMRQGQGNAQRQGRMDALQMLSQRRDSSVPGSRTRYRDNLIYGGGI